MTSQASQNTTSNPKAAPSRRGFFLGTAALGAGAAALSMMRTEPVQELASEVLPTPPENGGGYSLSAHVKRYYQTTLV